MFAESLEDIVRRLDVTFPDLPQDEAIVVAVMLWQDPRTKEMRHIVVTVNGEMYSVYRGVEGIEAEKLCHGFGSQILPYLTTEVHECNAIY